MHRVMNEKFKCFNVHGHTYLYELEFECAQMDQIGYTIDFKEIKRIAMQWIDDHLDHAAILNPDDTDMQSVCVKLKSKMWIMRLNGAGYCNPTVENIAKEVFLAVQYLMIPFIPKGLSMKSVTIYETPNCLTYCNSVGVKERENFITWRGAELLVYRDLKGIIEYDDRKEPTS